MRRKTKVWVVLLMTSMVSCSILLFIPNPIVDCIIGILGLIGSLVVIFAVPNANEEP